MARSAVGALALDLRSSSWSCSQHSCSTLSYPRRCSSRRRSRYAAPCAARCPRRVSRSFSASAAIAGHGVSFSAGFDNRSYPAAGRRSVLRDRGIRRRATSIAPRRPAVGVSRAREDALLAQPLATAEFLVVDTETNGLGGRPVRDDRGGRGARRRRGAARRCSSRSCPRTAAASWDPALHGDHAGDGGWRPGSPTPCCRRWRRGSAAGVRRPQRLVRPARAAPGVRAQRARWPDPPAICTASLARALMPLQRDAASARSRTRSASRSRSHTGRCADAETCARFLCACSRGCARTRRRSATPSRCCRRGDGGAVATVPYAGARGAVIARRPSTSRSCPTDPGVYLFRDGHGATLYVGKSVSIRTSRPGPFCARRAARRMDRACRDRRLSLHAVGARRTRRSRTG